MKHSPITLSIFRIIPVSTYVCRKRCFSKVATTDPRATDGEDETDQRPRKNDVFADRARTCNELLRRTANKLHELITIWKRKLAGIVRFCTMRLHWKQI